MSTATNDWSEKTTRIPLSTASQPASTTGPKSIGTTLRVTLVLLPCACVLNPAEKTAPLSARSGGATVMDLPWRKNDGRHILIHLMIVAEACEINSERAVSCHPRHMIGDCEVITTGSRGVDESLRHERLESELTDRDPSAVADRNSDRPERELPLRNDHHRRSFVEGFHVVVIARNQLICDETDLPGTSCSSHRPNPARQRSSTLFADSHRAQERRLLSSVTMANWKSPENRRT